MKSIHILIVEDDDDCRLFTEMILKELGCTFEIALNGHESVDKVGKGKFDAVLMDVLMPVMKGYDAIAAIRQIHINLPIIVVTAYRIDLVEQKCFELGVNDYLIKPFQKEELAEKLKKWTVLRQ